MPIYDRYLPEGAMEMWAKDETETISGLLF